MSCLSVYDARVDTSRIPHYVGMCASTICMCVCMYICIYVYMYICIYVYMYTYMHIHAYMHMCTCIYVYESMYMKEFFVYQRYARRCF